ncbi:MAG: ansB [Acidimicrobiales bacterium]|nr:ansB [Acidimicrobiales bacterium]
MTGRVRWGERTAHAVEVLSFSGRRLGDLPTLAAAFGAVKVATARANGIAGVLPPPVADALARAAAELAAGAHLDQLVADPLAGGGGIAVHLNVNEVIADLAADRLGRAEPLDPRRVVGASQSTADVCHVAARLAVIEAVEDLLAAADAVVAGLVSTADRFGDSPTLSRTCLRDGLAVPARFLVDGWVGALRRRRASLAVAAEPLHSVVLGATVIGDGAGAPPAYREVVVHELIAVTGRPLRRHQCPASALEHSDDLVDVAAEVAAMAAVGAKVARDLRLLGSGPAGGLGEIVLPSLVAGSSSFAAKVDPVGPETLLAASAVTDGCLAAARSAAGLAELHLQVFDLSAAVPTLDGTTVLARAFEQFAGHTVGGIELDRERCAALATAATRTEDQS